MTVVNIIGIIIFVGCLIGIFILFKNDKINSLVYKIEMCEKELNDILKAKEENIMRLISIINKQLDLELKEFEEVKNIKVSKINNQEKDKLLTKTFSEISKIYLDNTEKLNSVKSFEGVLKDIDINETSLISLRTLYNKCASEFNLLKSKFPYGLICNLRKLKTKDLYDGKELHEVIEKELNNLVI